jgi:phage terminase small subunit
MNVVKKEKLTYKEKKFVLAKAKGLPDVKAMKAAGYGPNSADRTLQADAMKMKKRPRVQAAIEQALDNQGLTVEFAVEQIGKVARQDDEIGAKRLAAKDLLELHGWSKKDKPQVKIEFGGSFFERGRDMQGVVEGEIVEEDDVSRDDS